MIMETQELFKLREIIKAACGNEYEFFCFLIPKEAKKPLVSAVSLSSMEQDQIVRHMKSILEGTCTGPVGAN